MIPLAAPLPPQVPLGAAPAPGQTALETPMLGRAAVTAMTEALDIRHDPPRQAPAPPPRLPAPLKGLGIPPLNTRQVGDFDKLDDPPPPMGIDLPDRLAELDGPPTPTLDLRR